VTEGRLAADHALIVERWLQHLTDDGLLQVGPDGTFRGERPLPEPSTQALVAATARDFDGLVPLLDYVCRCGAQLASVLAGDERALGTMFPDGSLSTVEFLYGDWAVARYVNAIARAALAAVAAARPRHALRVIEVGAGTGGTAAVLLPALGANGGGYAFTDVSELFLVRAAERFAEAPGVRFARLDIEQPPVDQGLEPEGYDVVVATNVLDGTADLARSLAHARSLVGPGGVLIASVTTRHPRWLDLTTGLVAGWRRMTEEERRREPVIAPERWPDLLHHAGFTDVEAWPRADQPTAVLGQQLLLARVAGEPSARPAAAEVEAIEPSPDADQGATVGAVESFDALTAALSSALPSERTDVLVDIVRGAISRVLRITDPGALDRDQPLLDLGLDSLMAVELRNVLRDTLRLPKKLPATLLFDHPNIAAIAGYLEHLVFGAPAADEPVVPQPAGPTTTPQLRVDAIAALSDAEVEALLLQKLSEI
jgi:SAM-dependent methyltransferase/acyl carrier protein